MAEAKPYSRLSFVDMSRGLAVLLMLQTHAYDAWLRPELRETDFFRWSQLIGGLPAAFFLFLMGISSALGSEKARASAPLSHRVRQKGRSLSGVEGPLSQPARGPLSHPAQAPRSHRALQEGGSLSGAEGRSLSGAEGRSLSGAEGPPSHQNRESVGPTPLGLIKRGLGRAALLLAFAFAFRISMYLASDRPDVNAIFRVDILNCLALSLALLCPIDVMMSRGARVFTALGAAAWFAMATSFIWDGGLVPSQPERIAGYLSGRVPNSFFPVFPWAAYAFAGHALGTWIGVARGGTLPRTMNRVLALGVFAMPVSMFFDRMETLGPRYDYWWTSPNFVLFKTGVLMILVALCFHFEHARQSARKAIRAASDGVCAALIQMGRTSLFIYCIHVDLVYGSRALPKLWRSCEIGEASRNLALLALAMLLLSYAWSSLKQKASFRRGR